MLSTDSTRALDLAARVGGEEFVPILHTTSQEGPEQLANGIRRLLTDKARAHANSAAGPWLTVSWAWRCLIRKTSRLLRRSSVPTMGFAWPKQPGKLVCVYRPPLVDSHGWHVRQAQN